MISQWEKNCLNKFGKVVIEKGIFLKKKSMECTTRRAAGTADILTAQFRYCAGDDDDIEQMEFDFWSSEHLKGHSVPPIRFWFARTFFRLFVSIYKDKVSSRGGIIYLWSELWITSAISNQMNLCPVILVARM